VTLLCLALRDSLLCLVALRDSLLCLVALRDSRLCRWRTVFLVRLPGSLLTIAATVLHFMASRASLQACRFLVAVSAAGLFSLHASHSVTDPGYLVLPSECCCSVAGRKLSAGVGNNVQCLLCLAYKGKGTVSVHSVGSFTQCGRRKGGVVLHQLRGGVKCRLALSRSRRLRYGPCSEPGDSEPDSSGQATKAVL
jgi:hypothetical protein